MRNLAQSLVSALLDEAVLTAARSIITNKFHNSFVKLPTQELRSICHAKYRRWMENPETLNFEPKHGNVFACHIDGDVHAVCQRFGPDVVWLFVAGYREYTRELDALRRGRSR